MVVFKHISSPWLWLALIPGGMIFGPLPFSSIVYYILLIVLTILSISGAKQNNFLPIAFLISCALSIIIGQPAPLFKSWPRLGLFAILLIGVFPVFSNKKIWFIRSQLFKYTLWLCAFIGVSGVFCYFAGINYFRTDITNPEALLNEAGLFAGFTRHSMLLGPCGAIGIVFFSWLSLQCKKKKIFKYLYWGAAVLCLLTTFLSASRGATFGGIIGFMTLLFVSNRGKIGKFIGIIILLAGIFLAAAPSLERFTKPLYDKQERNDELGGTFSSRQSKWEHRIDEFKSNPMFGVGFAAVDIANRIDYDPNTGTTEAGSSWLALLSMTGLMGFSIFCAIYFPTVRQLTKRALRERGYGKATLYLPLLSIFFVTMFTEGYLLAGGSFFCYFFWLLLGLSYSETHPIN